MGRSVVSPAPGRIARAREHPAFKHQLLSVRGAREPSEEAFERVELVQFIRRTMLTMGQTPQIPVSPAFDGGAGGLPARGQRRISSVDRNAGSAFGNARAMLSSVAG